MRASAFIRGKAAYRKHEDGFSHCCSCGLSKYSPQWKAQICHPCIRTGHHEKELKTKVRKPNFHPVTSSNALKRKSRPDALAGQTTKPKKTRTKTAPVSRCASHTHKKAGLHWASRLNYLAIQSSQNRTITVIMNWPLNDPGSVIPAWFLARYLQQTCSHFSNHIISGESSDTVSSITRAAGPVRLQCYTD
jgi:hypothetical protein